jgi:glutamate racemase
MHRAAIGIFDSGIGGLTVATEIARQLPSEDIIYLGDTARLPYGTRSPQTVARYAENAAGLLLKYPIKALVVACNTASAYALSHLQTRTDVPVLGVIQPGARAAAKATTTQNIGIAGTEGTVRSGVYEAAIRELVTQPTFSRMPWPLLVSLAEEGWIDHEVTRLVLKTYLKPFAESGVDTLVLGCTHYPVFKDVIRQIWLAEYGGGTMALIDSAEEVTLELKTLLEARDLAAPERAGRRTFFCTDAADRFQRVGATFFKGDLSGVTVVDLSPSAL